MLMSKSPHLTSSPTDQAPTSNHSKKSKTNFEDTTQTGNFIPPYLLSNEHDIVTISGVNKTDPVNIPLCKSINYSESGDSKDEDDDSRSNKEETLAESSLPWRRSTSLPPVPSSVSLSLPDDENPLMSEAPSWADNLAYSHLTETGSPYNSPNNTITAVPKEPHPRPVFDLFPPSSPPHSDTALPSLPPPWSCTDTNVDHMTEEPLPSQSLKARDAGDKASCLLVSAHDLVPPSYHSCLELNNRGLEPPVSRRHSEASSPVHFQLMEKPDSVSAAAMESQLIGIEEDYHHAMTDRVSMWLASHGTDPFDQDELPSAISPLEEGVKILESLRRKKENWTLGDTDDGTDADVESDDDIQDTRL
ncbi:hypothetical protein Btru_070499 [Bulinus truncatus]|nr:hypothetical protein Btru_070499 [Bulinus truncatus]